MIITNKNILIHIVFISFLISILTNIIFFDKILIFLGDINTNIQLSLDKLILLTLSLIGETSILSLVFYLGTKKFFK